MPNVKTLIEPGMDVLVLNRPPGDGLRSTRKGKVLGVVGGAARVMVQGENHPRTVRFNMIEIPEIEKKLDKSPVTTSMREKLKNIAPRIQQPVAPAPARRVVEPPAPKVNTSLEVSGGKIWIIAELTPLLAEKFLANQHPGQRSLREAHVLMIAKSMEAKKYKWTGDPIRFDRFDRLIDGQHRLTAVALSGVTLKDVIAVRVEDDEVSSYLDTTVKPRSLVDVRRFNQQKTVSQTVIAAILMDYTQYSPNARAQLSKPEQNEIVEACEYLDELAELYKAGGARTGITAAHLSAMYACVKVNRDAAMVFFDAVCRNEHSIDGKYEPMVKLLADWLIQDRDRRKGSIKSDRGRGSTIDNSVEKMVAYKIIRAYNAWRLGETPLKLQVGDKIPEVVKE